jgi:hypothetical protein
MADATQTYLANTPAPNVAAAYAPVTSYEQERSTGGQNLINTLLKEQQGNISNYTAASNALPTEVQTLNQQNQQYGIPGIENQIQGYDTQLSGVQQQINNLSDTIKQRSAGSGATAGQLQGEQQVMSQNLSKQGANIAAEEAPLQNTLNYDQQQIAQYLGAQTADEQNSLKPYILQIDSFATTASMELTGYNNDTQARLSTMLSQVQSGVQVDEATYNAGLQDAMNEDNFVNQKALISEEASLGAFTQPTYDTGETTTGTPTSSNDAASQEAALENALQGLNTQSSGSVLGGIEGDLSKAGNWITNEYNKTGFFQL